MHTTNLHYRYNDNHRILLHFLEPFLLSINFSYTRTSASSMESAQAYLNPRDRHSFVKSWNMKHAWDFPHPLPRAYFPNLSLSPQLQGPLFFLPLSLVSWARFFYSALLLIPLWLSRLTSSDSLSLGPDFLLQNSSTDVACSGVAYSVPFGVLQRGSGSCWYFSLCPRRHHGSSRRTSYIICANARCSNDREKSAAKVTKTYSFFL